MPLGNATDPVVGFKVVLQTFIGLGTNSPLVTICEPLIPSWATSSITATARYLDHIAPLAVVEAMRRGDWSLRR